MNSAQFKAMAIAVTSMATNRKEVDRNHIKITVEIRASTNSTWA